MSNKLFGVVSIYGLLIACAILAGTLLCQREARRRGLPRDTGIDMILWAVPLAVIGARLYYVAFRWPLYAGDPLSILRVWEGGLAIYGGIIGGFVGLALLSRKSKIPLLTLLDIGAPMVILGQAIGRWGNYFNGEAYGRVITDPAWQFFPAAVLADGQWHMATFFYESCWNLLGFVLLWLYRRRAKRPGDVFFRYLLWYGAGRAVIEGLRTDSLMWGPVRVSQALSLLLALGAAAAILIRRKKAPD